MGSLEEYTKDANKNYTEKSATAHNMTYKIAADCNGILAFLQTVTLKSP